MTRDFTLSDFDFALPPDLIAQQPASERSASRLLDGTGPVPADRRFRDLPALLAPGDLLVAYTDGVTDAPGGPTGLEMFGDARLRQAIAAGAGLPPAALIDRLLQLVDEWLGGQVHDDIAMLVVAAG